MKIATIILLALSLTYGESKSRVVAVMDFENITKEKEHDWIGRGFSEAIIYKLAKIPAFTVVERSRLNIVLDEWALAQSGIVNAESAVEIGNILQADILIIGSYQVSDDYIVTTARYVDVVTGKVLDTRKADGYLHNIFSIEEVITLGLLLSLQMKIQGYDESILSHKKTESVEAFKYLQKANQWIEEHMALKDKLNTAKLDSATKYALLAVSIDPLYADAHNTMGVVFEEMGYFTDAVSEYQTAVLGKDSTWYLPYFNMGNVYFKLGFKEKAYDNFKKSTELYPRYAEGYYAMGVMQHNDENFNEAKIHYNSAVKLNPNHTLALINLGEISFIEEKIDEAIIFFQKAIDSDPSYSEVYYKLAIMYALKADLETAKYLIEKAISINNNIKYVIELNKINDALLSE